MHEMLSFEVTRYYIKFSLRDLYYTYMFYNRCCFPRRMDRYRFTSRTFSKLEHFVNVQKMMHAHVPHMGIVYPYNSYLCQHNYQTN